MAINLFNVELNAGSIKKICQELKNIPEWLKMALYTSIIIGVFYFLFIYKPFDRAMPNKTEIIEVKNSVDKMNKKVNTLVSTDDYQYDKKQLLILLTIINTINEHVKIQENMGIDLSLQYIKKYHPEDKNIIVQFNELKNNNTVFYNNYMEEINELMNKYFQKSNIDKITSSK